MQAVTGAAARIVGSSPSDNYQLAATVSLSQDVVISDNVIVDATRNNPLACFPNPGKTDESGHPHIEALALVAGNNGTALNWVQRCKTGTGWQMTPITLPTTPTEVAGGLAISQSPAVFYADGAQFYWLSMNPGTQTWSAAQSIFGNPVSNLAVAYNNSNVLVAYGMTADGNLLIAQPAGDSFTAAEYDVGGALANATDFVLCIDTSNGWWLGIAGGSAGTIYNGVLGQTASGVQMAMPALPNGATVASVKFAYYMEGNLVFVVVGSDGVIYSVYGDVATPTAFPGTVGIAGVLGQISMPDSAERIRLFAYDQNKTLWALNTTKQPWNDQTGPAWAPWIPLAGNIGTIVADMSIARRPSLFTINASDGSVGLWVKEVGDGGQWRSNPILQSGPNAQTAYQVTSYRAEFSLMNNGVPAPACDVTLALAPNSSTTEISIAGQPYTLTPTSQPLPLQTDPNGKVTVAILVTDTLAAPAFVLSVAGTAFDPVQVNGDIKSYLSGGDIALNPTNPSNAPLPMDGTGNALVKATLSSGGSLLSSQMQQNTGLVSTAAQGIISIAGVNPGGQSGMRRADDPVGFAFNLDPTRPSFAVFHTHDDMETWRGVHMAAPGDLWGDIEDFASDVYQGVKNGLIGIANALVNVENGIVQLTATIGNDIAQAIQLTLTCVDDVVNLVAGVFQAIDAAIEDVVNWLTALFDFQAIWNTKVWIENAITQGLPQLQSVLGAITVPQNWFSNQYQTVNTQLSNPPSTIGNSTMGAAPGYQSPGQLPGSAVPNSSTATTGTITNNVHHNWLQDKVTAGGAPALAFPSTGMDQAFNDFINGFESAFADISQSFGTLTTNFENLMNADNSFDSLTVGQILNLFQDMLQDLLKFADELISVLLTVLAEATGLLASSFTTPLDLGPINMLWAWIADQAGQSGDPLTIASLMALLLAFPLTIGWKLAYGVDTAPFPSTPPAWPTVGAQRGIGHGDATSFAEVAQFVRICAALPAVIADTQGPNGPKFFGYLKSVSTLTSLVCMTGLATEEEVLAWAEANPLQAANLFSDAIIPAIIAIAAYKSIAYTTVRVAMGPVGLVSLIYNIYQLIETDTTDTAEIFVAASWPLPNMINAFFPNGYQNSGEVGAICVAVIGMIYFFDPILNLMIENNDA